MKPMFGLRVRLSDHDPWMTPEYFPTQAKRDAAERMMRITGGFRTHSWHETKAEAIKRFAEEGFR